MKEVLLSYLQQLPIPHELQTLLAAMLPVLELRGAIPYAHMVLNMGIKQAYLWAVVGNMIPVIPLLLFLGPVSDYLRRYAMWDRFFTWLFNRTRKRSDLVEKMEVLGLALFVAVPLPITGAWTGTVAAFLFDIPFKHAFFAILAGVLIAGFVVSMVSMGLIQFWTL